MPTAKTTPKLTPEVVANDRMLVYALDRLLRHDPQHQRCARRVLAAREALRTALTPKAWDLFLLLEIEVDARLADALSVAVRWAFAHGRKQPTTEGA